MYGEKLRENQLQQLDRALEQSMQPREVPGRSDFWVTERRERDEPA